MLFGRNYKDHANELNHEVEKLYVLTKAASSLTGDNATIPNHKDITDQLDYEGELGIVIGKSGEKIPKALAWVLFTAIQLLTISLIAKHKVNKIKHLSEKV